MRSSDTLARSWPAAFRRKPASNGNVGPKVVGWDCFSPNLREPMKLAQKDVSKRRGVSSADRRRQQLRDQLWPGSADWIWDINNKEAVVGFATVPRLLPLIMCLIRHLAGGKKSGDPSQVY